MIPLLLLNTIILRKRAGEGAHFSAEVGCVGRRGVSHALLKGEQAGELPLAAGRRRCLREGEREVKALPEALEGQEGVRGEVACAHLAVGRLVAAGRTLALEPADEQVDAGAAVLAHSRSAAAGAGGQLAAISCTEERGKITMVCDEQHCLRHPRGFHLGDLRLL